MLDTIPPAPRVAIYARFSSKLQKPTSIEDQVRLCKQRASDLHGTVVSVHSDRAATAATRQFRPGLHELLLDAENGRIDVIVAEALDRLSRDQEDMAGIHKRLRYWNVRLVTLEQGEIDSVHICIGGLMSQSWTENLAAKTRRGQIGAVHAGRIPGALSYGYRSANLIDDKGQITRGLREIDPEQAEIVRRIYRLYADSASPREIASRLNAEAIPGPRGRPWGQNGINGNRTLRNGILNNELYRGRVIYGRQTFVRNPDTGKRQARAVPESEWIVEDVPEYRIVDDALWNLVHTRRRAGHDRRNSPQPRTPLPLTGILRCGECGGTMTIGNKRRYACHARRDKATCSNPRGIDAQRIENQACTLLALHLAEQKDLPALMQAAAASAHRRREAISEAITDARARINRLLDAIETGAQSTSAHRRILEIEQQIGALEVELLALPDIPSDTPAGFSDRLHGRLANLNRIITNRDTDHDQRRRALMLVAGLIERIDVVPRPGRGRLELRIEPRTDALVALALKDRAPADDIRPRAAP